MMARTRALGSPSRTLVVPSKVGIARVPLSAQHPSLFSPSEKYEHQLQKHL